MNTSHSRKEKLKMNPNLLEYFQNSVTNPGNEHGAHYEVSKCRCESWFCPDCCKIMGYKLRARLIPVLGTFQGLFMVTLTVDPLLFPDPKTAYLYMQKRRCIGRTTQDLDRLKYIYSRRYLYVVEWQKNTEQAHFHILLDASYIPWDSLLASWSKHRPPEAGAVVGNRPAFGTVLFSAPKFDSNPLYAARYATKYLIKTPEYGFPDWVLDMGKERRIRRFDTSKGFWGNPAKPHSKNPYPKRTPQAKSYRERLTLCGNGVNIIEIASVLDPSTGEVKTIRQWVGKLDVEARKVIEKLFDPGNPKRSRRSLLAQSPGHAKQIIEAAAGKKIQWLSFRRTGNKK
jgi:hypothetical protein